MGSWNKYHAKKVKCDDITFDSKMEHKRYCELKLLQQNGKIEGLVVHPKFLAMVNGVKICTVILDFQYYNKSTNSMTYEDIKGMDTPISKLKRKLIQAIYPQVEVVVLTAK